MPTRSLLRLLACGLGLLSCASLAQQAPSSFVTDTVYASSNGITAIEFDHQGRLLYTEKQGRVMMLSPNGSGGFITPPTVYSDIRSLVVPTGESGLLGMSLDPDFANNRFLYLLFTSASDQRLVRLTAAEDFASAPAASLTILLSGLPRNSFDHKAGDIHFAPSDPSSIYIALGDDSSPNLAQSLTSYAGKLLRVAATNGQGLPENPFFDGNPDSIRSRIFAIGLRNPFRFTFHPNAPTGEVLYSSENGNSADRLSFIRRGSDGAWGPGGDAGFINPPDPNHRVLSTWGASVVGVAISPSGPFGSDVVYWGQWQGNIRRWQLSGAELDTATALDGGANFKTGQATIDFAFGPDGHLYSCAAGNNAATGGFYPLQRLRYVGSPAPIAAFGTSPDPALGPAPLSVQFTDASSAPGGTLSSRHWSFGDGSSSNATNPSHTYAVPGVYQAQLTVTNNAGQQSSSTGTIRAVRTVQVSYRGTVRDGRTLAAPPLPVATELRFYQADGTTPAGFSGGLGPGANALAVNPGGTNPQTISLNLTSSGLVISAGEPAADGVQHVRRGWQLAAGSGPHLLEGDYYLSSSSIRGRLTDTRGAALAADVGIRRGTGASASAYAVPGGRDYLAGGPAPTGVAHRTTADSLGWFHFALRDADADSPFSLEAVADTRTSSHARIEQQVSMASSTAADRELVAGLWQGGLDCDSLSSIPSTPAVDYAAQIQPIWNQACIGCHSATVGNAGGLDLSSPASQAELLLPSTGAPGVRRVQGARSDRSYLMEKINCGNPQHGSRMRPASPMALNSQALVRDWIQQLSNSGPEIFANGFE